MTVIHLNVKDVAIAALAAYDAGKLSAQGPTPACKYRDPSGLPCAVGAALSDEDAMRFDKSKRSGVSALVRNGVLTTDDTAALTNLQILHDGWVAIRANGRSREDTADKEQAFVTYARSLANRIDG